MDSKRLKKVITNLNENRKDIEKWKIAYRLVPDIAKPSMEEAFRCYIRIYNETVIKYLSICNKGQLYTNRGSLNYKLVLQKHMIDGDIVEGLQDFLMMLQRMCTKISYGCRVLTFKEVFDFYNENLDKFELLYNTIESKYESIKGFDSDVGNQLDLFK